MTAVDSRPSPLVEREENGISSPVHQTQEDSLLKAQYYTYTIIYVIPLTKKVFLLTEK